MEDIINQITNEKEYKENELKRLEKEQNEFIIKSNKEKNYLQKKIKIMENAINQIINEKDSKDNELKKLEKEKNILVNKINQISDVKNNEFQKEKNDYQIKIKNLEAIINKIANEKQTKENELKKLEKEKNDFIVKNKDMEKSILNIANEKEIKNQEINKLKLDINNLIGKINNLENEKITYNKELQKEKNDKNNIVLQNNQMKEYINQLKANNQNNQNLNNKLIEKENIIQYQAIQIQNLQNKINQLNLNKSNNDHAINTSIRFSLKEKYQYPSLKGLVNIGSTCYMNATLQCFSQTEVLTTYFLDPKNKNIIINGLFNNNNPNNLRLANAYYMVVSNLWNNNGEKWYQPDNFKSVLGTLNPLFKKMEASDAKDMIVFFLEQIHKEINKVNPPKISQQNPNLNQYDRNNMLSHFVNEFKNTSQSIISDNFFIISETTQKCQNCRNNNTPNYICYNYNITNCFIFPLEEVRKHRDQLLMNNQMMQNMGMLANFNMMGMNPMMQNMGMNMFMQNMNMMNMNQINTNTVTLYDCFMYNQKDELMTGENRIYCNLCRQNADSYYGNKILTLPYILIMILNRGKGNIYKIKLDFPLEIDLTPYVLNANEKYIFSLYGVITHIGESGESGHFIASCKSPIDKNKWYKYNDSIVSAITDFNKEVVNFGTPYILFYERKKNN